MQSDIKKGLISDIDYRCSPNQDDRPSGGAISGIVIHNISLPPGEFGGGWIDDLFLNQLDPTKHPYFEDIASLRVSSHLLIRRDGELIQYVPFTKRAWHAGQSNWNGKERCNDFTIGIELEGCDEKSFEVIQYQKLAAVTKLLIQNYSGLSAETIKGHSEIAPERKTDPGPYFDWQYYHQLIKQD